MTENLEDLIEIANPQQTHCATVLLLDTSSSMSDSGKITALSEGLSVFKDDLLRDELAAKRVDLAIITFGENVEQIQDFSTIDEFEPPNLIANGYTPMGEAILKAIDLIEQRKSQYKDKGIDYYRPWIFMITDGDPTDMQPGSNLWNDVVREVHQGEANGKFMFFAVAVEPANLELLNQLAPPNRAPVSLKGGRFKELFEWLSNSQSAVANSQYGEKVKLEDPVDAGWGQIST